MDSFGEICKKKLGEISETCSIWVSFKLSFSPPRFDQSVNGVSFDALVSSKTTGWNFSPILRAVSTKKRISPKNVKNRQKWLKKCRFWGYVASPLGILRAEIWYQMKVLPRRSSVLSLIQFLRAVFEQKAKKTNKVRKNVKFTPFGMPGCPIVIRWYMQSSAKSCGQFLRNLKLLKRSAS